MVRKWIVLALAAAMLASSTVLLNTNPISTLGLPLLEEEAAAAAAVFAPGTDNLHLVFSETGHFYDSTIEVSVITSIPGAKVFYTMDGSEPTVGSGEYTEPLRLIAAVYGGPNIVTLKAIAVYGDTVTRPLVHTYFIGRDAGGRFDTLVFSISTDREHLYDYDTGIFVEGRTRADYIRENPGVRITPPSPANFNWRGREGERPAYIEVFTQDGQRVLAQAAGIRVHGGWSRANDRKSIRLIARREYEPDAGRFHFDFFPDDVKADAFGSPLLRYDEIVLRNGGNDDNHGLLRHEVGSRLARQAGLRVATPARPAAVFLNGEYHGFAWINVSLNKQYLEDVYDAPTRDFQIVGSTERWVEDSAGDEEREAIEYLADIFRNRDLTDDAVFAEFEALIDIDDTLLYYAFQTYMGNNDWPNNNFKRWRYVGPQRDGLAPELDGRWRHVTYDLDWTLGLYDNPVNPNKRSFQELMNEDHSRRSRLLIGLLKREDMRDRFAMILCDIAANIVTEQNVRDTVGSLYAEAANEIGAALDAGKYDWWFSREFIRENHNNMAAFARGRPAYVYRVLREHFGFGEEMFDVAVTGGEAVIGTQKGVTSRYFAHLTVPLRPVLPKFTVFSHWVVNGTRMNDFEIFVSADDARDGVVSVELVTREELPPLIFTEATGFSGRNGCVLLNPAGETVNTEGLYLTNDLRNPFLWALDGANVAPGGTLELAGRGSGHSSDLHRMRMGFNVRQGQMLYLCDASGAVLDTIIAG
jgi:hypothetical protein